MWLGHKKKLFFSGNVLKCLRWHIDHQNRIKQIKFYIPSFEYFQSDAKQTILKWNDTQMKMGSHEIDATIFCRTYFGFTRANNDIGKRCTIYSFCIVYSTQIQKNKESATPYLISVVDSYTRRITNTNKRIPLIWLGFHGNCFQYSLLMWSESCANSMCEFSFDICLLNCDSLSFCQLKYEKKKNYYLFWEIKSWKLEFLSSQPTVSIIPYWIHRDPEYFNLE